MAAKIKHITSPTEAQAMISVVWLLVLSASLSELSWVCTSSPSSDVALTVVVVMVAIKGAPSFNSNADST
jgi:membrane protein YdbS with pleckstrin-like domain